MTVSYTHLDGVIHELHAHGLSADDDVRDFLRGAFTDDGRHGGRGKEDFIDGYASIPHKQKPKTILS